MPFPPFSAAPYVYAGYGDDGFPSRAEWEAAVDEHFANIPPSQRYKYCLTQAKYDQIVACRLNAWSSTLDSNERAWARKNFDCVKLSVLENQSIAEDGTVQALLSFPMPLGGDDAQMQDINEHTEDGDLFRRDGQEGVEGHRRFRTEVITRVDDDDSARVLKEKMEESGATDVYILTQNDRPIAVREALYDIFVHMHQLAGHGGRDRTAALVDQYYAGVALPLVGEFCAICTHCKTKKGRLIPVCVEEEVTGPMLLPINTQSLHEWADARSKPVFYSDPCAGPVDSHDADFYGHPASEPMQGVEAVQSRGYPVAPTMQRGVFAGGSMSTATSASLQTPVDTEMDPFSGLATVPSMPDLPLKQSAAWHETVTPPASPSSTSSKLRGFINYSPKDADKLMDGVAPSGTSKSARARKARKLDSDLLEAPYMQRRTARLDSSPSPAPPTNGFGRAGRPAPLTLDPFTDIDSAPITPFSLDGYTAGDEADYASQALAAKMQDYRLTSPATASFPSIFHAMAHSPVIAEHPDLEAAANIDSPLF